MLRLWLNATMLAIEAQQVIFLRSMRIAMGGAEASREMNLMFAEKAPAMIAAAGVLMKGGSPNHVIHRYRKKVRSNARRLSR